VPSSLASTEPTYKGNRLHKNRCTRTTVETSTQSHTILYRAPITIPALRRLSLMAPCRTTPRTSRETQASVICLPRKLPV
jgi:hypothetical protein